MRLRLIFGLIETLWNVNYALVKLETGKTAGFNRNIVECKLTSAGSQLPNLTGLIETLWNVNRLWEELIILPNCGLIETLWNVNL